MTVAPLEHPETTGVSEARAFARRHGYVPRVWAEQLLPFALSHVTIARQPSPGGPWFMLDGFAVGCDYCERPMTGDDRTCRGCGAPL